LPTATGGQATGGTACDDPRAFMGSNRVYRNSESCSVVIWQSRRILCRRPGPMVSPECAGTTVLRPSGWRRK
jgi:hypothetical protein